MGKKLIKGCDFFAAFCDYFFKAERIPSLRRIAVRVSLVLKEVSPVLKKLSISAISLLKNCEHTVVYWLSPQIVKGRAGEKIPVHSLPFSKVICHIFWLP